MIGTAATINATSESFTTVNISGQVYNVVNYVVTLGVNDSIDLKYDGLILYVTKISCTSPYYCADFRVYYGNIGMYGGTIVGCNVLCGWGNSYMTFRSYGLYGRYGPNGWIFVHPTNITAKTVTVNIMQRSPPYSVQLIDNIPPTVTITSPIEGVHYRSATLPELSYSVTDNLDTNPTISVTGWSTDEGVHTLTINATDTAGNIGSASVTYTVDNTPPIITLNGDNPITVYIGSTYTDNGATAIDNFDGPVSVTSTGSVDTNTIGTYTITYTATDSAGNSVSMIRTIKVLYNFSGFFKPIDNLPTWNSVKAGSTIPTKFSLGGYQGLDIFTSGYPASQKIDCASNIPIGIVEGTVTAGSSNLSYNATADQYNYIWKTDKGWAGSCRQLIVQLKDGTYHNASFNFKK
jgi:hypothetical protein